MSKIRADQYIYENYNFGTLEDIRRLIMAGKVLNNNEPIYKSSDILNTKNLNIRFKNIREYVSRGGVKLKAAIDHFNLDLTHVIMIDIGSSTGGFTDCSIQNGAKHVYAVDVGTNQLDYSLRTNTAITVMEQTNFKDTKTSDFPLNPNFMTIDVSFTSIIPIIKHLNSLFTYDFTLIGLIKPQFESYLEEKEDSLIIKNITTKKNTIRRVVSACSLLGLSTLDVTRSPITGTKGNEEYLLLIKKQSNFTSLTDNDIDSLF